MDLYHRILSDAMYEPQNGRKLLFLSFLNHLWQYKKYSKIFKNSKNHHLKCSSHTPLICAFYNDISAQTKRLKSLKCFFNSNKLIQKFSSLKAHANVKSYFQLTNFNRHTFSRRAPIQPVNPRMNMIPPTIISAKAGSITMSLKKS